MPASDSIFAHDFQIYSVELLDAALCYINGKVFISFCVNNREQFHKCYPISFPGAATDFSCDASHVSVPSSIQLLQGLQNYMFEAVGSNV